MIERLLQYARENDCSDLHLSCGEYPAVRQYGQMIDMYTEDVITPESMRAMAEHMLSKEKITASPEAGDIDFCYVSESGNRHRVNIYRKQGNLALVARILKSEIPTLEGINAPPVFTEIANLHKGLVLVTGPTGSGKSTTLAAIINHINENRNGHILTFEDPVEFEYKRVGCIIGQREVGKDAPDFATALRSALRQDPDVILVGEMRDLETISAALTAAETGHLVLSTLHTMGAAKTIDRIIDSFPPEQQQQVRVQLGTTLKAVVSQVLIPGARGGRVAAHEIMLVNEAVANNIKQGKTAQIDSVIELSSGDGMKTIKRSIQDLYDQGKITVDEYNKYVTTQEI